MFDVVVLSPTPTHPIDFGNRKRIHRMTQHLKDKGCRIIFVLYALEQDWRQSFPEEAYQEMLDTWDEVHVVIPTVPYHASPEGNEHKLDDWWDPALEKFLWWLLRSRNVDACITNYIYLSRALTLAKPTTLKILDTHDRFGGRHHELAKLNISPEFFYITESAERKGISRADVTIAIKPEEEVYFKDLGAKKALTVSYSEPLVEKPYARANDDGYLRIGMIGGRNNINRKSTEKFLQLALPRFFSTMAPIKIVLAGSMCLDYQKFGSKYNIEIMGSVENVEEFYDSIDLAVIPMEISTGQKIKVGEALGFGVPVISTAHAFEGYFPSNDFHQCDSIEDLVEKCIDLSFDQSRLDLLAQASRLSAQRQEESVIENMDALYSEIAYNKQCSIIRVDGKRFISDVFLQHHLLALIDLLSIKTRLFFVFENITKQTHMNIDTKKVFGRIKQNCNIHFENEENQDTVYQLLNSTNTVFFWDYGSQKFDIAKLPKYWQGHIFTHNGWKTQNCSFQRKSTVKYGYETGYFIQCIRRGNATGKTRFIPTPLYHSNITLKDLDRNLLNKPFVSYISVDKSRDLELVVEFIRILEPLKYGVIIVCENDDLITSFKKRFKKDPSKIDISYIADPASISSLSNMPLLAIDLTSINASSFIHIKQTFLEVGLPMIVRDNCYIRSGTQLYSGTSDLDLTLKLLQTISNLQCTPQIHQDNPAIEDGWTAMYNFLTTTSSITMRHRNFQVK